MGLLHAPRPAGGAHYLISSSLWFWLFEVEMAGSWLGWNLKGCCRSPPSLHFPEPLHEVPQCLLQLVFIWWLSCLVFAVFVFGFRLDSFRIEGRSQILQLPVGWSGALLFICFRWPIRPILCFTWGCLSLKMTNCLCGPVKTPCFVVFDLLCEPLF